MTRLRHRYWLLREQWRRLRRGVLAPIWTLLTLPAEYASWAGARRSPIRHNHLLLLAWHFPPATNGGVFRPLSFARYAGEQGWTMHVVSEAVPPQQWEAGRHLLDRVPSEVQVTRFADSRSRLAFDFLPQLDGGLANLTHALGVIRHALGTGGRPSLVLASGPPFFTFPLARLLAWLLRVPYVVEYRDEWTLCPHDFVEVGWLDRVAERWTLAGAAHVAFATQAKLDHCIARFPVFERARASVVPNGWDPSLVDDPTPVDGGHTSCADGSAVVRLAFAGTLASHADPTSFLKTLERLLAMDPQWRGRLVVEFIGHKQGEQAEALERFAHDDVIHSVGFLRQDIARTHLRNADILLIFNTAEWHRYLQGKFLEYLAVPRPILLYGAGGEMESLLLTAESGLAVPENDPAALGRALEALADWREADHPQRASVVHSLRRDVIAANYFGLLGGLQASADRT